MIITPGQPDESVYIDGSTLTERSSTFGFNSIASTFIDHEAEYHRDRPSGRSTRRSRAEEIQRRYYERIKNSAGVEDDGDIGVVDEHEPSAQPSKRLQVIRGSLLAALEPSPHSTYRVPEEYGSPDQFDAYANPTPYVFPPSTTCLAPSLPDPTTLTMSNGYPPAGSQNAGQGNVPWGGPFPALHMWPLHDTFQMKMIHLPQGEKIKIGRQTNAKTVPGERNACFDSKVLSRTHAEIWEQNGKIYIKDVKSSNGTFINGERLSQEGVESHPHELKSEDVVEFGIDIVSEDNRSIVHHKVAAKVYCVYGPAEAALSARELQNYQAQNGRARAVNGAAGPANPLAQSGQAVMSAGGKPNALSFNHVLHKLQAELARSKETGSVLQNLTTTMSDIQDTLGGGLPPSQNGSAAQLIPPQFRSASAEAQAALAGPHGQQAAAFISLQNQLTETHTSLDGHLDKIRQLENQLREHETVKTEISALKAQMEEGKREMELILANARGRQIIRNFPGDVDVDEDDDDEDGGDDDDDARSTFTLMANEDGTQRRAKSGGIRENGHDDRPATPEPHMNGHVEEDQNGPVQLSKHKANGIEMESRVQVLTAEIAEAVALSRTLQTQHGEAMSAVKLLTERVGVLESGIQSRVAGEVSKSEQRWESWRVKFEEGWRKERESWNAERERLRGVVREWEEASRRAHEEEEERELNESLSEDEFDGEEDDDDVAADDPGGREVEEGELLTLEGLEWQGPKVSPGRRQSGSGTRKPRRRRPSHRASLAVSALKAVAGEEGEGGSATPKAELASLEVGPAGLGPGGRIINGKPRGKSRGSLLARTASGTYKKRSREKSSSESGKDSADTLKEDDEKGSGSALERKKREQGVWSDNKEMSIYTALVVAVVAGTAYWAWKGKE